MIFSGGLTLKTGGMSDMKIDMGGGAAVSAALYGIVKLELPINVVVTIPLCENLPSGHATKPGDVIVAMNGKSKRDSAFFQLLHNQRK